VSISLRAGVDRIGAQGAGAGDGGAKGSDAVRTGHPSRDFPHLHSRPSLPAGEARAEAAAEFQKDRGTIAGLLRRLPSIRWPSWVWAGLFDDRGHSKGEAGYQDFFALWKDADPDVPILKEAKAEYEKLQ